MLNRILSQFVELLGKQWIWNRTDRKRKLEKTITTRNYTQKHKTFDDMNEVCEIINMSSGEYSRQFADKPQSETNRLLDESFNKVMSLTYQMKTID